MSGSPRVVGRLDVTALVLAVAVALGAGLGLLAGASPKDAIGAVAVLAFVPIVVWRFSWSVAIFIITTYLGISGVAQKGLGGLVVLGALGVIGSGDGGSRNFFAAHRRLTGLLISYAAWCVVGLIWAPSSGEVLSALARYVPNLLVFVVVYAAARDRVDVRLLVGAAVLGSALAAGDAVVTRTASDVSGGPARAGGTFGDPNELAAALVAGLALALALLHDRRRGVLGRAMLAVAVALCVVGILFSVSRGGLIALGVSLLLAICVAGRWRGRIALGSVMVVAIALVYFALIAPAGDRQRLTTDSGGGSGRTTIWKVGWREVEHHPVLGVGAGNFSTAGAQYVIEPGLINHETGNGYQAYFIDTPTVAHNTYLEVLAEGGAIGLALLLAIIASSLSTTWRAAIVNRRAGDAESELLCYALLCGTVGFLAACFFLSEEYSKQLWVLLALGPVMLARSTSAAGQPRNRSRAAIRPRTGRMAGSMAASRPT